MNATRSTDPNTPEAKLGSVESLTDGRECVKFVRRLPYSIDQVWAAITDPDQLANWFPGFTLPLQEGGRFTIWFGGNCEGPAHVEGEVTRFEPPSVLECGSMRFELRSDGDGTELTFTDILHFQGPRTRAEFCNSVLGGWHGYLDNLELALAGQSIDHARAEPDYAPLVIPGRD